MADTHLILVKAKLKRRGFIVKVNQCAKRNCACQGRHYAISGNGIRKNNLTDKDINIIIRDYPPLSKRKK